MSKFKFWHSVSEEPMLGLGIIVCNKELDLWEASYIGGGRIQLASKYGTLPDNIFKLSLFEGWAYRIDLFKKKNFDDAVV